MSRLIFLNHWKTRTIFWCGAIAFGLVAVGFAYACWAVHQHARLIACWPYLAPLITLLAPPWPSAPVSRRWCRRRRSPPC